MLINALARLRTAKFMMQEIPTLGPNTSRILDALLEQAMEGYSLLSKTGLSNEEALKAIEYLKSRDLLAMEGEMNADSIRRAYFYVPTGAKGTAKLAVQTFLSQQAKAS
jgi:hypothetical protein